MKLKLFLASLLFVIVAHAQITDESTLRGYINANIFPNNTRNVTAQQLNNIMNGTLNVMDVKGIDSFAASAHFDTLYIYQHNATGIVLRKGYKLGGNFDTTSLNNRINALNTSKLNLSDSGRSYVTPSQLAVVSGGNVYHSGDNIVQISGSAITVDTITSLASKSFLSNNYAPKTRTINSKSLSGNITLTKGDFTDLNQVDNTSDMSKPLSNPQHDSLARKVDKTTTINSKPLSGNVVLTKDDLNLSAINNTSDADKPVSTAAQDSLNASTFERSLKRNNTTTQDDSIDATGHRFAVAADEFAIKGKGLITKFGVISRDGTTGAAAVGLGFPVGRSQYTYNSSSYPFETLANAYPSLEVHVVINSTTTDGTQNFLDSASIPAYLASIGTVYDNHIAGHTIVYFAADNEPTNAAYRTLSSTSIRRYAYTLKSLVGLLKRKNPSAFTSDGGLTGIEMKWLPWHWLDSTGQTALANEYLNSQFTAAQISAGISNWATTGAHAATIARIQELNGYEKTMDSLDAVSLHWTEATTDVSSFDSVCMRLAAQYYCLVTGKQVVFNEVGVNNQSSNLLTEFMNTFVSMNTRYAIFYNNTDTSFTGNDNAITNGGILRANGMAASGNLNILKNAAKDIFKTANGFPYYPSLAQPIPVPAYLYPDGHLGAGPVNNSNGTGTDSSYVIQKVAPKLDSLKKSLTTTAALMRLMISPQSDVIYQFPQTEYEGGSWYFDSSDHATADNTGLYIHNANGTFKRIIDKTQGLNIKWYKRNIGDSVTVAYDAFLLAKADALALGISTINFPAGKFPAADANGWYVNQSHLYLKGAGKGLTTLLPAAGTVNGGLQIAPYRDAGWDLTAADQYTYADSAAIGQDYIVIKAGQDMSAFYPKRIIFINDGASYYDQYYGEFNRVDKVEGNRVYLKENLSRDYTSARGSWYGTLTSSFTIPAEGSTAVAQMNGAPVVSNYTISINNNLFQVIAVSGTSVTLLNLAGKGNASGTLPTGAHVMKGRSIIFPNSAIEDVHISDMTVVGRRKALVISNSYNTTYDNVDFKWLPATDNGGLWLDGDGGKNATLTNCTVSAPYYFPSQIARSFVGFGAYHSTFNNVSVDFTEFATKGTVDHCTFNLGADTTVSYPNNPALTIGASTQDIAITNNTLNVSGRYAAIASNPDIQVYHGMSANKIDVSNNTLFLNNCNYAFNIKRNGDVTLYTNHIYGSCGVPFNIDGVNYADTSNITDASGSFVYSNSFKAIGNTFSGKLDYVTGTTWHNIDFENNDFNREGLYTSGGDLRGQAIGNIIQNDGSDTTKANLLIVKGNTFRHWNTAGQIFRLPYGIDTLHTDISLNRFYDAQGGATSNYISTIFSPYDNRYALKGAISNSAITDTSNLHRQDSILNQKVIANTSSIASNTSGIASNATNISNEITRATNVEVLKVDSIRRVGLNWQFSKNGQWFTYGTDSVNAASSLTSTYIGYGSGSNSLAGSSKFQFDGTRVLIDGSGSGVNPTTVLNLNNATAAVSGTQQSSPAMVFGGNFYNTTTLASSPFSFSINGQGIQGNPTSQRLSFTGPNGNMYMDGNGNLTLTGNMAAPLGVVQGAQFITTNGNIIGQQLVGYNTTNYGPLVKYTNAGSTGQYPDMLLGASADAAPVLGHDKVNGMVFIKLNSNATTPTSTYIGGINMVNINNTAGNETASMSFSVVNAGGQMREVFKLPATGGVMLMKSSSLLSTPYLLQALANHVYWNDSSGNIRQLDQQSSGGSSSNTADSVITVSATAYAASTSSRHEVIVITSSSDCTVTLPTSGVIAGYHKTFKNATASGVKIYLNNMVSGDQNMISYLGSETVEYTGSNWIKIGD